MFNCSRPIVVSDIYFRAADETKSKTVVAPKSRLRKTYTVYDENDVAYKVWVPTVSLDRY